MSWLSPKLRIVACPILYFVSSTTHTLPHRFFNLVHFASGLVPLATERSSRGYNELINGELKNTIVVLSPRPLVHIPAIQNWCLYSVT